MGDWLCRIGTTSSLVLNCDGFPGFTGFFILDPGACLGNTMTSGTEFAVLPILLVFVTSLIV